MAVHFARTEFDRRRDAAVRTLKARGLAGILLFKQESMFYLTGYDTFGFCFFQCLWLERRADDPAHPCAGSQAGAAHVDHRRHPHLGR